MTFGKEHPTLAPRVENEIQVYETTNIKLSIATRRHWNMAEVRSFRGADFDAVHYLLVM